MKMMLLLLLLTASCSSMPSPEVGDMVRFHVPNSDPSELVIGDISGIVKVSDTGEVFYSVTTRNSVVTRGNILFYIKLSDIIAVMGR